MALSFGGSRLDGSQTMRRKDGSPLYGSFFGQSSFSSRAVVNMRCMVKVDSQAPLHLYASLGCGMQTGAGGIMNALDVQSGATVAVFGTGAVGLAAVMAAKVRGAGIIIGVDTNAGRLELAKELGATHVVNSSGVELVGKIEAACQSQGLMYGVDTTGVPRVIEHMVHCLGPLGKALTLDTPPPESKVQIDVLSHLVKGRQYIGCNQGNSVANQVCSLTEPLRRDIDVAGQMVPYLIDQHRRGRFPLERLVKTYDIDNFQIAIEDAKAGNCIKPVILWSNGKRPLQ